MNIGDAIGWTNGKTRFWIGPADAKGRKHKHRVGEGAFTTVRSSCAAAGRG